MCTRTSLILTVNIMLACAQVNITLTSTLIKGRSACPYSEVIFTCETRGSNGIYWASVDYIGPNDAQLAFQRNNAPGDKKNVSGFNDNTIATLTKNVNDVLRSQLLIMPNQSLSPSTISCTPSSYPAMSRNVTFQVLCKSILCNKSTMSCIEIGASV